jgi:hypothetical protein
VTTTSETLHTALAQSALSPDQAAFLSLHVHHNVEQWKWHWSYSLLRARTDKQRTASLSRLAVEQLVAWGLMCVGAGHSMYVTSQGREAVTV